MSSRKNKEHKVPNGARLQRRRSSLPNIKLLPMTMAERRLLARQKRKQEEEAAKLAKQLEAEEKKQRIKQLRQAAKATDKKQRTKYTLQNGKALCAYCKQMIDELEYDDHIVSHPTRIRNRIWLGNSENSRDLEFIETRGITHILNCTREIECPKNVQSRLKGFKRIAIQDKNSETILDYIVDSNRFVEEALSHPKSTLFVHCREGRSRSVSFLCAYLMWKEGIAFLSALADIRSKRHIVLPNNKFYAELERFDKELSADRDGDQKRFGVPDSSFKLQKLQKNKRKAVCQTIGSKLQKKEEDDMKIEPIDFEANVPSMARRQRSNSFHSPSTPSAGKQMGSSPTSVLATLSTVSDQKKKIKKPKKKKKTNKDQRVDVDLNVAEALDVTDIFPQKKKGKGKKKKKKVKSKSAEH